MLSISLQEIIKENHSIGKILNEIILRDASYKIFFDEVLHQSNFEETSEISQKVEDFIKIAEESEELYIPADFIEYLINDKTGNNILLKTINKNMNIQGTGSTSIYQFKEALVDFRNELKGELTISYIKNVTKQVLNNKSFSPVIGREKEIESVLVELTKIDKNNPILIGETGTGKTAIVESIAYKLKDKRNIYATDYMALSAASERKKEAFVYVLNYLSTIPQDVILFIDEIHQYIEDGLIDKEMLARHKNVKIIAATTLQEYKKYIQTDKALERRFFPIQVNEVEGDVLKEILIKYVEKLKQIQHIDYDKAIIDMVIEKMDLEKEKTSPDKQKDVLDTSFAYCVFKNIKYLDKEVLAENLSIRLNIPKEQILSSKSDVIKDLKERIGEHIKGQSFAINQVTDIITSNWVGFKRNSTIGNFIFMGQSGVGKTEFAKVLAKQLTGSSKNLLEIHMNNYKERHTVASLLGAPPGYIGHGEGGSLINFVRQHPFSVILFDEIEKAHSSLFDVLLSIMDEGMIRDYEGRLGDFRNTVIIMTSNLGAPRKECKTNTVGFVINNTKDYEKASKNSENIMRDLNSTFKREFINRLDSIIPFSALKKEDVMEICKNHLVSMVGCKFKDFEFENDIIDFIVSKSDNSPRQLDRVITNFIINPISKLKIEGKLTFEDSIKIILDNGNPSIEFL